jgi:hypothetical protein
LFGNEEIKRECVENYRNLKQIPKIVRRIGDRRRRELRELAWCGEIVGLILFALMKLMRLAYM